MDANSNEQAKEALQVVLHALKFFCYFVLFVTIAVVQKCAEFAKDYMNKQDSVGAQQPPSVKGPLPVQTKSNPNYQSIGFGNSNDNLEIKAPANTQAKAAIRDPQYQTLVGLTDEIFKKK